MRLSDYEKMERQEENQLWCTCVALANNPYLTFDHSRLPSPIPVTAIAVQAENDRIVIIANGQPIKYNRNTHALKLFLDQVRAVSAAEYAFLTMQQNT